MNGYIQKERRDRKATYAYTRLKPLILKYMEKYRSSAGMRRYDTALGNSWLSCCTAGGSSGICIGV
jgi:hypothetical protein